MTRYSVQPRDRIFVKEYGFLYFARNMGAKFDLIYGKIADKIKKVSKTSPQNNSVTIKEEILRERCISPAERQKNKKSEHEIGLKQMMDHKERISSVIKLNLKIQ